MTPKEKAIEMYDKMLNSDIMDMTWYCAKQCALIAVEEIIAAIPTQPSVNETERIDAIMYWIAVKQEIEKL
jgi:hypothetical protein